MPYAELLGKSAFSFLQGASRPEELVEMAQLLDLSALAICDRDGLYGSVRAHVCAREIGQRVIVGAELTLAEPGQKVERSERNVARRSAASQAGTKLDEVPCVALLVKNARGYENLCHILTRAHAGLPKGESLIELEHLVGHTEGLVAIVPVSLTPEKPTSKERGHRAELGWSQGQRHQLLATLRETFGEGQIFSAVYRRFDGKDDQRVATVEQWTRRYGIEILASARPLFHDKSRKPLADVVHCIREGATLEDAGDALEMNAEAFLRSESQMLRLFRERPIWVGRTAEVAEELRFSLSELDYQFPCAVEPGTTAQEKLQTLTWQGMARRYPAGPPESVVAQVEKELHLIAQLDMAPYFLSTWEVVEIARERRILCQGRGSAANSAVCYALGITAVDPARSNLLFERFMSLERQEPPDIDVDFEHERREEVIQEIYRRHGRDRAAMVSEVICYRGKSALREVGKVFGLSLEQIDRLTGTITHWDSAEVTDQRLAEAGFDSDSRRIRKVILLARALEGFPRHLSIHVGGFVLSAAPLHTVAPVEPARMEGRSVIPWDKDDLEALGFFKIDVLGLGMLTAIRKALALIHADGGLYPADVTDAVGLAEAGGTGACNDSSVNRRQNFDPLEVITWIPPEEPAVYAMISEADTVGVFQIESRAQMAMLPRLRPQKFYDLVIEVAIVRPGPIQGGMVHPYLRRRNKEEKITSPHPDLWPILKRTLGVPLFQEQVMQISIAGAGYTGGEADQLRRDMAAWKKSGKLLRHRERLLSGFERKGISREFGEALFEQIKGFGDYGFPESHAASFALLVYASSWEKVHYPAHFCCALLNSQPMGFYSPSSLVRDAQKHGVEVRPVSVLRSNWDCTLEAAGAECRIESRRTGAKRALRLGLRLIRGLGEGAALAIEAARERQAFTSVEDVIRRARLKKNESEALAEAGAFEELIEGRRHALWKARAPRLTGLFADLDVKEPEVNLPKLRPVEQLMFDYGRVGLSIADHPMRHWRRLLNERGVLTARALTDAKEKARVEVGGLVLSRQQPGTASGVVFITIEDETGCANLVLYHRVFERFRQAARHATLLLVAGHVERQLTPARPGEVGKPTPIVHVIVDGVQRLDVPGRSVRSVSRDFH